MVERRAPHGGGQTFIWHDPKQPVATTPIWGAALDLKDTYLLFVKVVLAGRAIYTAWKHRQEPPPDLDRIRALARTPYVRSPGDAHLGLLDLVERCAQRFHAGD